MSEPKNESKEEKLILENEWKKDFTGSCLLKAVAFKGERKDFIKQHSECGAATKIKDPISQPQAGDDAGLKGTKSDPKDKSVSNANDDDDQDQTSATVKVKNRKKPIPLTPPPPPKDIKKPESKANGNKPCVQQFEEEKNGEFKLDKNGEPIEISFFFSGYERDPETSKLVYARKMDAAGNYTDLCEYGCFMPGQEKMKPMGRALRSKGAYVPPGEGDGLPGGITDVEVLPGMVDCPEFMADEYPGLLASATALAFLNMAFSDNPFRKTLTSDFVDKIGDAIKGREGKAGGKAVGALAGAIKATTEAIPGSNFLNLRKAASLGLSTPEFRKSIQNASNLLDKNPKVVNALEVIRAGKQSGTGFLSRVGKTTITGGRGLGGAMAKLPKNLAAIAVVGSGVAYTLDFIFPGLMWKDPKTKLVATPLADILNLGIVWKWVDNFVLMKEIRSTYEKELENYSKVSTVSCFVVAAGSAIVLAKLASGGLRRLGSKKDIDVAIKEAMNKESLDILKMITTARNKYIDDAMRKFQSKLTEAGSVSNTKEIAKAVGGLTEALKNVKNLNPEKNEGLIAKAAAKVLRSAPKREKFILDEIPLIQQRIQKTQQKAAKVHIGRFIKITDSVAPGAGDELAAMQRSIAKVDDLLSPPKTPANALAGQSSTFMKPEKFDEVIDELVNIQKIAAKNPKLAAANSARYASMLEDIMKPLQEVAKKGELDAVALLKEVIRSKAFGRESAGFMRFIRKVNTAIRPKKAQSQAMAEVEIHAAQKKLWDSLNNVWSNRALKGNIKKQKKVLKKIDDLATAPYGERQSAADELVRLQAGLKQKQAALQSEIKKLGEKIKENIEDAVKLSGPGKLNKDDAALALSVLTTGTAVVSGLNYILYQLEEEEKDIENSASFPKIYTMVPFADTVFMGAQSYKSIYKWLINDENRNLKAVMAAVNSKEKLRLIIMIKREAENFLKNANALRLASTPKRNSENQWYWDYADVEMKSLRVKSVLKIMKGISLTYKKYIKEYLLTKVNKDKRVNLERLHIVLADMIVFGSRYKLRLLDYFHKSLYRGAILNLKYHEVEPPSIPQIRNDGGEKVSIENTLSDILKFRAKDLASVVALKEQIDFLKDDEPDKGSQEKLTTKDQESKTRTATYLGDVGRVGMFSDPKGSGKPHVHFEFRKGGAARDQRQNPMSDGDLNDGDFKKMIPALTRPGAYNSEDRTDHKAVDLFAPIGSKVYSPIEGEITRIVTPEQWKKLYGDKLKDKIDKINDLPRARRIIEVTVSKIGKIFIPLKNDKLEMNYEGNEGDTLNITVKRGSDRAAKDSNQMRYFTSEPQARAARPSAGKLIKSYLVYRALTGTPAGHAAGTQLHIKDEHNNTYVFYHMNKINPSLKKGSRVQSDSGAPNTVANPIDIDSESDWFGFRGPGPWKDDRKTNEGVQEMKKLDLERLVKEVINENTGQGYAPYPYNSQVNDEEQPQEDFAEEWKALELEIVQDKTRSTAIELAKILVKDLELFNDVLDLTGKNQSVGQEILNYLKQAREQS